MLLNQSHWRGRNSQSCRIGWMMDEQSAAGTMLRGNGTLPRRRHRRPRIPYLRNQNDNVLSCRAGSTYLDQRSIALAGQQPVSSSPTISWRRDLYKADIFPLLLPPSGPLSLLPCHSSPPPQTGRRADAQRLRGPNHRRAVSCRAAPTQSPPRPCPAGPVCYHAPLWA